MCEEYAITNDMCTFISPTYKHTITDDIYSKYVSTFLFFALTMFAFLSFSLL